MGRDGVRDLCLVTLAAFALRLAVMLAFPNVVYADEIFQVLEPAHRLVFGTGVHNWEWVVGIRSWLLPGFVAGLMRIGLLFGTDPAIVNFPIQAVMLASSAASSAFAYLWGRLPYGRAGGLVTAGIVTVWPDLVYMAPHTFNEVLAGNLMVPALWLAYPAARTAPRRPFLAGLLFGLAAALRIHLLPAILIALLWTGRGQGDGGRAGRAMALGLALPLLGLGLLDWATLGTPFQSIWLNIWLNVFHHVSEQFGRAPWFALWTALTLVVWGTGFVAIGLAIAAGARRLPLLLVMALAIIAIHSLFGHKEYRFIYPALPLLAVLAGLGTMMLVRVIRGHAAQLFQSRWSLEFLAVGSWSIISMQIIANAPAAFHIWPVLPMIAAYRQINATPAICGLATDSALPLGRSWLRPDIGYFLLNVDRQGKLNDDFNAIILPPGIRPDDPRYTHRTCFDAPAADPYTYDFPVCLWTRPGRCVPAPDTMAMCWPSLVKPPEGIKNYYTCKKPKAF